MKILPIQLKNIKKYNIIGFLGIFAFFGSEELLGIISIFFGRETTYDYQLVIITYLIIVIIIFIKNLLDRQKFDWILLVSSIIYGFLLLFSWLLQRSNEIYIIEILRIFFITTLPLIVIINNIGDPSIVLSYIRVPSYIALLYVCILPFTKIYTNQVSYMTLTYSSQISWAVITYFAFSQKKLIDILFTVITSTIYIIFGARGGAFVLLFYYLFCINLFARNIYKIIIAYLILILITILSFNIKDYANFIFTKFEAIGLSSRNISILLFDNIGDSSNRFIIYDNILSAITNNPFGLGIGSDRVLGGSRGYYAHNMFLEIILNYGIIFGGLIIILLILIFIKMLFFCKDHKYKILFSIFAIPGFVMLQFSSSLYLEVHIFISLYLYIKYRQDSRRGLIRKVKL